MRCCGLLLFTYVVCSRTRATSRRASSHIRSSGAPASGARYYGRRDLAPRCCQHLEQLFFSDSSAVAGNAECPRRPTVGRLADCRQHAIFTCPDGSRRGSDDTHGWKLISYCVRRNVYRLCAREPATQSSRVWRVGDDRPRALTATNP